MAPAAAVGLVSGCDLIDSPTQEPLSQEYYEVERDTRRCAAPRCGGYFLNALNQSETLCFDGSQAERCYVAEIGFTGLETASFDPNVDLVRGTLEPLGPGTAEGFARLVANEGWSAATVSEVVVEGSFTYFRVADNGIRCVTTPCFSITAESLNLELNGDISTTDFSNIDFDDAGLNETQQQQATSALIAGNLIVDGLAVPDLGQAGIGTALKVSKVFLPISSAACVADADCDAGQWCRVQTAIASCVAFAQQGDACEGFRLPEFRQRCAPGLQCDLQDPTGDTGGVCRRACTSNEDCSSEQFCAEEGLCHRDGSCEVLSDCQREGNVYAVRACAGALTCSAVGNGGFATQEGVCAMACGANPVAQ